jgi:SAM-dependent methyltransferase
MGADDDPSNARTIQSYDRHVREYVAAGPHSVSGAVKEFLDRAVDGLPLDARILEFGSASGRDASYLQELGYRVDCTDATPAFVDLLLSQGLVARPLNAITDELPREEDLVLANAVLLHFTRDEAATVIAKVRDSLRPGGRFAFSLKQGEGENWSLEKLGAPRFFCYWTQERIREVLVTAGFREATVWTSSDPTRPATTWLMIIAVAGRPLPLLQQG